MFIAQKYHVGLAQAHFEMDLVDLWYTCITYTSYLNFTSFPRPNARHNRHQGKYSGK